MLSKLARKRTKCLTRRKERQRWATLSESDIEKRILVILLTILGLVT